MSKTIIVANWKMNPVTWREAKKLFESTKKAVEKTKNSSVIVAPPVIFLRGLSGTYRGSRVAFAVQNGHFKTNGAHTGEISLAQSKDAHASYVIIGHVERRASGETNDDAGKKAAGALALKMIPILCVGESERTESGEQFNVVREQIRAGLADVPASALGRVILVYEPLWTIGTNTTMNPSEMHQMAIFMRKCVVETHGGGGRALKILYGGGVDGKSAEVMLREGDVCGFLVGRASLNASEFAKLLQAIENV